MKRFRRWILAALLLLLLSVTGAGIYRAVTLADRLPSMGGNVYSMLSSEKDMYMVLSDQYNNSLVHTTRDGTVLNYCMTGRDEAFQYMEQAGDTIYAIQNRYQNRKTVQYLVSLSLNRKSMRTQTLCRLSGEKGIPEGVTWKELYLEGDRIRLAGIAEDGKAYLLDADAKGNLQGYSSIPADEQIFRIKYVKEGHFVWIDQSGRLGQSIGGVIQKDVLAGKEQTATHISTCGTRILVSDSKSGNIHELFPDGSTKKIRNGKDTIGKSPLQYLDLELFTTREDKGEILIVGLCESGEGSRILGDGFDGFSELKYGTLRYLVWLEGLALAGPVFLGLAVLAFLVRGVLRSRRVFIRMAMSYVLLTAALLLVVSVQQYQAFQSTMLRDAEERLKLIGGNMAGRIGMDTDAEGLTEAARSVYSQMDLQIEEKDSLRPKTAKICVVYEKNNRYYIGYHASCPPAYQIKDVNNREYLNFVRGVIQSGEQAVRRVESDVLTLYIYAQRFELEDGTQGCVTVEQPMEDLFAGRSQFAESMPPILFFCVLLLGVLLLLSWRLLLPLRDIKQAMDDFYACGGGNRIERVESMPRTEFYDISRTFNKLSAETRVQFNQLQTINGAYERFVPDCMLKALDKKGVLEIRAGDNVQMEAALLFLLPVEGGGCLEATLNTVAGSVGRNGGQFLDTDQGMGMVSALFRSTDAARVCAGECVAVLAEKGAYTAVLHGTRLRFGVFGSEELLVPLAESNDIRVLCDVLPELASFGAPLIYSGSYAPQGESRWLGEDSGFLFWEDTSRRPAWWRAQWKSASALWEEAAGEYRAGRFYEAQCLYSRFLRCFPQDNATKWYLFRCEERRGEEKENGGGDA